MLKSRTQCWVMNTVALLLLANSGCLYLTHNTDYECDFSWRLTIVNSRGSSVCRFVRKTEYAVAEAQSVTVGGNSSRNDTINQSVQGARLFAGDEVLYLFTSADSATHKTDSLWINPFPFPAWEGQSLCSEYYEVGEGEKYVCAYSLADTIFMAPDSLVSSVEFSSRAPLSAQ
jgi:hypothetical protein